MSGTLAPTTPTNRRLAGVTSFTVDGIAFPVTEFSWSPGNVKRETMTSYSGVDGYKEMPKAPYVAVKLRDSQSANVTNFSLITNSTIVLVLANGKQIVGHNVWNTGDTDVSGDDATFDARFEGVQGTILEQGIG